MYMDKVGLLHAHEYVKHKKCLTKVGEAKHQIPQNTVSICISSVITCIGSLGHVPVHHNKNHNQHNLFPDTPENTIGINDPISQVPKSYTCKNTG